MGDHINEFDIPLLRKQTTFVEGCPGCLLEKKKAEAPHIAPVKELCFVALLVLCNVLPIASLFPFIYFMVQDFGIAKVTTQIGTYAGYIGSAIMVGGFITAAPWGWIADKYGRKPVIMSGTASIFVFNTLFGFSTNFWMALVTRFLIGFFNGMLGPIRAYASEICSEEHQALGLSMIGTMWGVGLIIGPAIGGYLAQPVDKYPSLFKTGSLFDKFPYALPCVCISLIAVVGFISCFFLPESLHNHPTGNPTDKLEKDVEGNTDGSASDPKTETKTTESKKEKSLWKNWGMIAAVIAYCFWGLHDMAYSEIFSLWAVSPPSLGGLGFTTSDVANVLAVAGLCLLLFQLFVFPRLAKLFRPVIITRSTTFLTIPLLMIYPLIALLSGVWLWVVLILAAIVKNLLSVCIVTGTFFLINNSVPLSQRGVANGISMSGMSLFRAIGPATAGAMFSWAQARESSFLPGMWMVFFILSMICFAAFLETFPPILPKRLNEPHPEGEDDDLKIKRALSFTF
ncbi:hypothetical protein KP509_34G035500 [Ceratopteris richardii]|uniref:Major facilitator superfamily (MFS) profile domain-containing protein n=1 Tax=Ceratopteris richardii TaxID=49495 RepID=A0A8T2QIP0_CERRI|nr:hypothetical protein KP509_34G035500 [Ceratopteris richardii]KAH7284011.1 hypothetical protein KP509_34G035500 [Ceratopteris richardii]KAH7284012.1 hypothetical protein KP509_34G035500 [Ceratopteris richardii]KAH7284013.1 hypothetical protein KP509_34G035500 [Ceratopteris richardii]